MNTPSSSPIFDQSYQPWQGTFVSHAYRAPVIAWAAMKNMIKSNGVAFGLVYGLAALILGIVMLVVLSDAKNSTDALYNAFAASVFITCLLLVPVVGGNLISSDIRHNAHLMYFSKSIYRADYMAGKGAAALLLLTPAILLPSLISATFPAVMSFTPVSNPYLARVFAALLLLVPAALLPAVAVCMAISSCTRRAWLAGIGWFAIFAIPWVVGQTLEGHRLKWAHFVSFNGNLNAIAAWVLPLPETGKSMLVDERLKYADPWLSALILAAVTVGSLALVFWRIGITERRS